MLVNLLGRLISVILLQFVKHPSGKIVMLDLDKSTDSKDLQFLKANGSINFNLLPAMFSTSLFPSFQMIVSKFIQL